MRTSSIVICIALMGFKLVYAQEAARIIEAFTNRCPLTAGGATNPLNQAMADITRSGELLNSIQVDREGGDRCQGAVTLAQQQFNTLNQPALGTTTRTDSSGGMTGTSGSTGSETGKGNDGGTAGTSGGSSSSTRTSGGGTPVPSAPSGESEAYSEAFAGLIREGQIDEYESQISTLTAELDNPATTEERRIQIENDIAHLQAQINSIEMESRISTQRHRLTVYQHVSQASGALLGALRSCQEFPDIISQLTPAAINIGSSLGAIGGASVLALDAISDLIGQVVAFFRDSDLRDTRASLERAYAPTAVRCAYLTMGEQFCHTLDTRRNFLLNGGDPLTLLSRDSIGRCELGGFQLLSDNVATSGGLADSISQISQTLNQAIAGPGAMGELDRLVFGNMGNEGLYHRIQQMDNYYQYVEDSLGRDLAQLLEARRTATDPAQRQVIEVNARRLTNMIRDISVNTGPTHRLMEALQTYRDNVYDNFDPTSDTSGHVRELNTSIMDFMNSSGGAIQFESSLRSVVDMHRETLSIRWSEELAQLNAPTGSMTRTELLQQRTRLRNRMRALTNIGNEEITRLASFGVADLAVVSSESRREAISNATEAQRLNLITMGRFLQPQLTENMQEVSRTLSEMNPSDASRGAVRDRLRGLCESTLFLPYELINETYRTTCGSIIYRNEGTSNVLFSEMYQRMRRGSPFSTEIACHQFVHTDNVSRDR